jgi:hypothetical protein
MFCKISVRGSNVFNRIDNLFKGIMAVATASAGSTPSATGSTSDLGNGTHTISGTGYEIVTDVISNAEAGGWELSPINEAVGSGSYAENKNLVIRRPTGKPDNPYIHLVGTKSFGSNHWLAGSVLGPSDMAFTSAVMSPANWLNQDYVGCGSPGLRTTSAYSDYTSMNVDHDFYVAANEEFIHIHSVQNHDFMHLGLRTNMSWEDNYSDNPYWVRLDADYHEFYWTTMRQLIPSTQSVSALINYQGMWWNNLFNNDQTHTIYGWNSRDRQEKDVPQVQEYTLSQQRTSPYAVYLPSGTNLSTSSSYTNGSYFNLSNTTNRRLVQPIITADRNAFGLTSDSTSGIMIAGAQPINIRANYGRNNGGTMKNLLQGGGFTNTTDRDSYFTEETTVNIDGTDYIGLLIDGGLKVIYVKKA